MAARNAILLRPQWVVANAVTMPLVTYGKNDKKSVRGLIEVIIPFTIFLDTLFDEARRVNNGR